MSELERVVKGGKVVYQRKPRRARAVFVWLVQEPFFGDCDAVRVFATRERAVHYVFSIGGRKDSSGMWIVPERGAYPTCKPVMLNRVRVRKR